MKAGIVVLALLLAIPANAQDKSEIMAVDQAFSDLAAEIGTRGAFARYLREDAIKLDGNAHPRKGHSEILPTLGELSPNVSLTWTPRDGKVAQSGELAYTWGTYVLRRVRDGEETLSYGKYTTVWEKVGGTWKAILDMGNPSPGPYPAD